MERDDLCETLNAASAGVASLVLQQQQNLSIFPSLDLDRSFSRYARSTSVLAALFYRHHRGIPIDHQTLQRLEVASWHAKEGAFSGLSAARLVVTDMAIQRLAHLRLQAINSNQSMLFGRTNNDPDRLHIANLGEFSSLSYATSTSMLSKVASGSYRGLPDKIGQEIHAIIKSCKSPLALPLEARLQAFLKATESWLEKGDDQIVMLLAERHT